MSDTPPIVPKRRWLWPVVFASLALNLLIVGIVAGAFLSGGGRDGRESGPVRSLMGEPFIRALEPSDRRAIVGAMVRNRDQLRENREALRARVTSLLDALQAEPFDRAAVATILEEQRRLATGRQMIGEEILLDRLEAMSAEERAAYADRLAKALKRVRKN